MGTVSPERRLRLVSSTVDMPPMTGAAPIHRGVVLPRHNRAMYADDVEAYLDWLRASGAPRTTLRLRRGHLERALTWIDKPPWDVRHEDLISYLSAHYDWSANTRKSVRTSLRSFFAWGEADGRADDDYSRRLPTVAVPQGKPNPCPNDVYERALAAATGRDRTMLLCAALTGMRRAEIARFHSRDVASGQIRIVGKGGKIRDVPLHPLLAEAIEGVEGYIFPGKVDGHLSPQWVGDRLRDLLGEGWSAHKLRHRFASRAYLAQRDILAIQELLGHSSVATTQIYTAVPDDAKRAAVLAVA